MMALLGPVLDINQSVLKCNMATCIARIDHISSHSHSVMHGAHTHTHTHTHIIYGQSCIPESCPAKPFPSSQINHQLKAAAKNGCLNGERKREREKERERKQERKGSS